jgi:prepilin-type N-terminal cleavage/methylation domain-containing protein
MRRRGFTFIEVLVGLALVSFLGAGLAGMMVQALAAKGRADRTAAMTALAVEKLELLKSLPAGDDALSAGRHEDASPCGISPLSFRRMWTVVDAAAGMKRVEIVVAPQAVPAKPFTAVLLISPALGFEP